MSTLESSNIESGYFTNKDVPKGILPDGIILTGSSAQQPRYTDQKDLSEVLEKLKNASPLIRYQEVESFKAHIFDAQVNRKFILMAGDCAERFIDAEPAHVRKRCGLLFKMEECLASLLGRDVVLIGRMAGQYAKPRSNEFEYVAGQWIPCFRGENINGIEANNLSRTPDPWRMWAGYEASRKVRMFMDTRIAVAHEALLLCQELALTREIPGSKKTDRNRPFYNVSAHCVWIGERTRQVDGKHVQYAAQIDNPIGIKISDRIEPSELIKLIKTVNPSNTPARVFLITRMGVNKIEHKLPQLVRAINNENLAVLWMCDPMHGNVIRTSGGIKTRRVGDIIREIELSIDLLHANASILNGLHLEITPDDVYECIESSEFSEEQKLRDGYQSYCDPRLNYDQSLKTLQHIAPKLKRAFEEASKA